MFRKILQPAYQHLNRRCLIRNQMVESQANGQRRHFVKKLFKTDKKTKMIFVVSFSTSLALMSYYEYRKSDAKPKTVKIKSLNKNWDSTQRMISDSLVQDSLVGNYLSDSVLDNLTIHKKVDGKNALPGKRLILLRYRNCPFCCKVKSFLDYYDIPHEIVEVNPLTKKQIKFSNYRKVPILLIEDEKLRKKSQLIIQLNDSSSIISVLGTFLFCNPNQRDSLESIINKYESLQYTTLDEKKQVKEISNKYFLLYGESLGEKEFKSIEKDLMNERKWRKWTDEVFVHVLSPNIYRTTEEAVQAFKYFSEVSDWERTFSTFERLSVIYIGSLAMFMLSKHLKKKYRLKEDVRQSLYDTCNHFLRAREGGNDFIGGQQPNLSDLSIYGALSSIEGCDAFQDLTKNTRISAWYFKMKRLVDEHRGRDLLKL